jgi:hypothetical protein
MKRLGYGKQIPDSFVTNMILEFDKNRDDAISFSEYMHACLRVRGHTKSRATMAKGLPNYRQTLNTTPPERKKDFEAVTPRIPSTKSTTSTINLHISPSNIASTHDAVKVIAEPVQSIQPLVADHLWSKQNEWGLQSETQEESFESAGDVEKEEKGIEKVQASDGEANYDAEEASRAEEFDNLCLQLGQLLAGDQSGNYVLPQCIVSSFTAFHLLVSLVFPDHNIYSSKPSWN